VSLRAKRSNLIHSEEPRPQGGASKDLKQL
jgi:hypothetical protein